MQDLLIVFMPQDLILYQSKHNSQSQLIDEV